MASNDSVDRDELYASRKAKALHATNPPYPSSVNNSRSCCSVLAVPNLEALRLPRGNMLEALKGDRDGQHSIRINGQYRICFVMSEQGATQIEIVDYH